MHCHGPEYLIKKFKTKHLLYDWIQLLYPMQSFIFVNSPKKWKKNEISISFEFLWLKVLFTPNVNMKWQKIHQTNFIVNIIFSDKKKVFDPFQGWNSAKE